MPGRWPILRDSINEFFRHDRVQIYMRNCCVLVCTTIAVVVVCACFLSTLFLWGYMCPDTDTDAYEEGDSPLTICIVIIYIFVVASLGLAILSITFVFCLILWLVCTECGIPFYVHCIREDCVWLWTSPDSCFLQPCARARAMHEPLATVIETPR